MNNYYVYLAQAYGEGAYNSCTFNCTDPGQPGQPGNPGQPTQPANPGNQPTNPNTGFWQQPSFLIPAILIVAVLLVGIEFLIRKTLKRRRDAKNTQIGQ
jgi:hypothetical protein